MIRQAATKLACYGLTVLVVLGVVAWWGLRLAGGVDPPVVATSSTTMEPAVRPGDLVLLHRARPGELVVGDVAAVRDGAGDVLVRRVASRDQKGTTFAYVLAADNRDARMNATDADVVGEVGRRIPAVGWLLIMVRTIAGKILLAGLCVGGILLGRRTRSPVTNRPEAVAYGGDDRPATRETGMSITPAELRHVRFAQVRKGYDTEAVDRALETVADSIEELLHERHELVERVRALEAEVERYRDVEASLSQTLTLAERAAEELKADAHAEAERMMAEARAQLAAAQQAATRAASAPAPAGGGSTSMPDPAFIELLGETRAIRSLLQALMTQAPGGNGGTPFAPRAQ